MSFTKGERRGRYTRSRPITLMQGVLGRLWACHEAREWTGARTPQEAWDQCENAEWLVWIVGNLSRRSVACPCRACLRADWPEIVSQLTWHRANEYAQDMPTLDSVRARWSWADVEPLLQTYVRDHMRRSTDRLE